MTKTVTEPNPVPAHLTQAQQEMFRTLASYVARDHCTSEGEAHFQTCLYCQGLSALDQAATAVELDYKGIVERGMEAMTTRIERQKRMAQRFDDVGASDAADGCRRAMGELMATRYGFEVALEGREEEKQEPDDTLARCTRPAPHDGPCNGLPCDYVLGRS